AIVLGCNGNRMQNQCMSMQKYWGAMEIECKTNADNAIILGCNENRMQNQCKSMQKYWGAMEIECKIKCMLM
ncbi:hypothetical protein, partial [Pseudomonas lurida]|uniref:hypothetical protein n=1 Tax=Pseudomonas lurida TaxID=244566 RepID=UPI0034D987BE